MVVANLTSANECDNYVKSQDLSVIHFYAPWAEQCSQIDEVLDEMSTLPKYKVAKFARVPAEDVPDVTLRYKVSAVPTVLLIKGGEAVDRVDGADPALIKKKIDQNLESNGKDPVSATEDLESRLKKLINQAPCMLFMKGSPEAPRCGFSRTIVGILDSHKADYQSFDILQDNQVREGLKKFSNWPTYPQLYLNGELMGGLDIVKEMNESGELKDMLPKKAGNEER